MATEVPAATTRAELYALVDTLPESELSEAKRLLTGLNITNDPVMRAAMLAPIEDEELSEEEEAMLADIRERRARGDVQYISDEELGRELGL